jgi:hypothetical protein
MILDKWKTPMEVLSKKWKNPLPRNTETKFCFNESPFWNLPSPRELVADFSK